MGPVEEVLTLPALVRRAVDRYGERDAVVTPHERVTFAGLYRASQRMAGRLVGAGVGKGARVAAQFSYGPEWVVTFLAVTSLGAIYVPLSTAYKPTELRRVLRHADAALLISPRHLFSGDRLEYLETALPGLANHDDGTLFLPSVPFLRSIWIEEEANRNSTASANTHGMTGSSPGLVDVVVAGMADAVAPSDEAVMIYTSGTTAEPKGVVHSHGALVRKALAQKELKGSTPQDRVFCGMPFFWVGGLVQGVMGALASGFMLLCVEKPDPEPSLDLMEREEATHIIGWPGVTGPIMRHSTRTTRRIPALDRPPTPRAGLGMTETLAAYSSSTSVTHFPEGERGIFMGRVHDGVEVVIVNGETGQSMPDGESGTIFVRGYPLMVGLNKHEREEVFTADGWYDTGDKGYLKTDLLFFEGRIKEMIKTSGNNVAPPEVESVLESFPEVSEAHVLGIPDAERGEIVAAAVVPASGHTIDCDSLRERARVELSNYKVPRKIVVIDQVPSLANGKPDRLAIRRLLIGG